MNKFLTIGIMIVIMSLLSCTSGPIGVVAAAILPLFAIIGVGLMTLNVLVANNQNQLLEGENDPSVVLGNFMDLMFSYSVKCARGLFFGIGKMIAWGMPDRIGGQDVPPVPVSGAAPSGLANGKGAATAAGAAGVKIKVHIYLHKSCRKRSKQRAVSVERTHRSRRTKVSVS